MRFGRLPFALVVLVPFTASTVATTAQAPQIGKPRPATTPPNVLPLPPAVHDNALDISGEALSTKKNETRMTVEVQVNGRGPYRFLVDSGADTSVVGLRVAGALQLPLGTPAVLNNMTSRNVVDRVRVAELSLGSSTFKNLHLPALREEHLGGDGIVGIDALVAQRLMMDFEKQTIKVEDAREPVRTYPGEIVVTAHKKRGQLILTQVRAAGLPVDAVIDTGSEVTIGNMALRNKLIRGNRDKFMTVQAMGVTGHVRDLQMAVISELRLGPVTLRNVPVAFADLPPFEIFGLTKEPSLLLGTDLLDTFRRVSLDFKARKVRFQLRKCGSSPVTISTMPSTSARLSTANEDVCRR